MNRLAKIIRIITVPPLLAFMLITLLYAYDMALLGSFFQYCALIFFVSVMPALAYPLQPFIPKFKNMGREGQRSLAFITSVTGYVCGVIFASVTASTITVQIICWTYFVSVFILVLFNKTTRWRASGHACGVAGPIISTIYFIGPQTLPMVLIFALMVWASLRIKRHTLTELILGGSCSIAAFGLVMLIVKVFI